MVIDLILVAILVKSGGGAFLGVVAAFVLFRASASNQRIGFIRQSVRLTLRLSGAILLFIVMITAWDKLGNRAKQLVEDDDDVVADSLAEISTADAFDLDIPASELPSLAGALFDLRGAPDSVRVYSAAQRLLQVAEDNGATTLDLHDARGDLIEFMGDKADSSEIKAIDAAIFEVAGERPTAVKAESITIAQLESQVRRLNNRNETLKDQLEEARNARGIRAFISGAADDLGVGFGWSAVYFTAFLALWRGQTPGKRVAKVRVLRLDGKPMGWWLSFERFGGYAASFSVGLLGFVQILWDRNRQGLHDKACETVVVLDSAQALSRS